jgi:microcystin-dependent protein
MSNYTRQQDFSVKDGLSTGNPEKIILGADIDEELDAVVTAVATKSDLVSGHTTGNLASLDANGNPQDSGESASGIIAVAAPTGAILNWTTVTPPTGWLECDGSAVSRATYAALYAVISDTFGNGDGSTTFNLPDLRGEFVRGYDDGTRGIDPDARSMGDNQGDSIIGHYHNASAQAIFQISGGTNAARNSLSGAAGGTYASSGPYKTSDSSYIGTDTETRPRNVALMYIIKT